MKSLAVTTFALGAPFATLAAQAADSRPWLNAIATAGELAGTHTVRAEADVEVSDGDGFSTAAPGSSSTKSLTAPGA